MILLEFQVILIFYADPVCLYYDKNNSSRVTCYNDIIMLLSHALGTSFVLKTERFTADRPLSWRCSLRVFIDLKKKLVGKY